ncbi:hypothetical protein [Sulfurimonas marina]|uniref:Uncharacterized protein n=1 Tax=Sulfurimonas marina TaxID=2590551 RepID=A0A7M1AV45_9BACT|nr:hypothetical protein [Sulfurimonas marina]QOP41290.1 hypothetical protein FJR03_05850 [Sulfurimonas marina]
MKKWFIGYLKQHDENHLKYTLIEEIDNKDFREKIKRVYDYEYLENLFLFIIKNFQDFQESIKNLDTDSKNNIDDNINNYYLQHHQIDIQRTFFNLINSYKLSIDHIKHTLSSYEDKEEQHYQFLSKIASFYYDTFAGYKIIENLRNYCQHRSLAPLEIIRDSEGNVKIFITKEALVEDKKIRNKIKSELDSDIPFNFIYLVIEWFEKIQEIYNYYFDLFAEYSKDEAEYLLSYFQPVKKEIDNNNLELYLLAGHDESHIDQYSFLPTEIAIKIINRTKKEDFKNNIEFISTFVKDYIKEQEENENFTKMLKEHGLKLPEFDTITLSAINRYLKGKG